jgi:hypothetical protein
MTAKPIKNIASVRVCTEDKARWFGSEAVWVEERSIGSCGASRGQREEPDWRQSLDEKMTLLMALRALARHSRSKGQVDETCGKNNGTNPERSGDQNLTHFEPWL